MSGNDRSNRPENAFTLVELLVVIAIIGVMVSLLMPAVSSLREAARRSECENHVMQLGIAMQEYVLAEGHYPSGVSDTVGPIRNEPQGLHHAWTLRLLPFVDEHVRFDQVDFSTSVYDSRHADLRDRVPAIFACPSSSPPGLDASSHSPFGEPSSYAGSHHDVEAAIDADQHGVLYLNSKLRDEEISDGRARTLLIGEKVTASALDLGWVSGTAATLRNAGANGLAEIQPMALTLSPTSDSRTPTDPTPDSGAASGQLLRVGSFGSDHPAVVGFAFADGSVRFLERNIDAVTLQHLAHRADGSRMSAP